MKRTTNKDLWNGYTPISVRDEDIFTARNDPKGKCPIFHAIHRVMPGFEVKVLRTTIQIFPKKGNHGMYGKMPWQVVDFGITWDSSEVVKPIRFDIRFGF